MYYYAVLNSNDIVIDVISLGGQYLGDTHITITETQYNNYTELIGKLYDRNTGTFINAPFNLTAAHSTDEINIGTSNDCLSAVLSSLSSRIEALENNV